jgi:hypothetical protein
MQTSDSREIAAFPQRFEIGTEPGVLGLGGVQITRELLNMTGALRKIRSRSFFRRGAAS